MVADRNRKILWSWAAFLSSGGQQTRKSIGQQYWKERRLMSQEKNFSQLVFFNLVSTSVTKYKAEASLIYLPYNFGHQARWLFILGQVLLQESCMQKELLENKSGGEAGTEAQKGGYVTCSSITVTNCQNLVAGHCFS